MTSTPQTVGSSQGYEPAQARAELAGGAQAAVPGGEAGPAATPHVIGLDLSLTASGIASSQGWCELAGRAGITTLPLHQREDALSDLSNQIMSVIGAPDLVVIEQTAFSKAYGGASERSGLWWMVVRWLRYYAIPVAEVKATTLKRYATGKGQCKKGEVIDAVTRRWPCYQTRGDDNLCDAIVLAAMGADHLGHPLAAVPKTHRDALAKVTWPEVSHV